MIRGPMVILLLGTLLPAVARAESEPESPEPVSIEEVLPTPRGNLVLRAGAEWPRSKAEGAATAPDLKRLQAYWGLSERVSFEGGLSWTGEAGDVAGGTESMAPWGSLEIGAKARAFGTRSPLVVRGGVEFPVGSGQAQASEVRLGLGIGSIASAGAWTLQGGAGYESPGGEEGPEATYGGSLARELSATWIAFAEASGLYAFRERASYAAAGPGLRLSLTERFSAAAAYLHRFAGEGAESRIVAQLQFSMGW